MERRISFPRLCSIRVSVGTSLSIFETLAGYTSETTTDFLVASTQIFRSALEKFLETVVSRKRNQPRYTVPSRINRETRCIRMHPIREVIKREIIL